MEGKGHHAVCVSFRTIGLSGSVNEDSNQATLALVDARLQEGVKKKPLLRAVEEGEVQDLVDLEEQFHHPQGTFSSVTAPAQSNPLAEQVRNLSKQMGESLTQERQEQEAGPEATPGQRQ